MPIVPRVAETGTNGAVEPLDRQVQPNEECQDGNEYPGYVHGAIIHLS
jgi:hypothetical protein